MTVKLNPETNTLFLFLPYKVIVIEEYIERDSNKTS